MTTRWKCRGCDRVTTENLFLRAPHPFRDGEIWGCPACKEVEEFGMVCDEPGCEDYATCGTPVPNGLFRITCGKHMPEEDTP